MPKCLLCQTAEATKKNSHIFPHFLIKTATNKGGCTNRDYELTFSIGAEEFIDTFFGRNITLDTILEYKGRELTEEEIKKQNPFAMDFLFCPPCEKYFDKLESYYASEVHQKLQQQNYGKPIKDRNGNTLAIYEKVDAILVHLFIYSIFFRCSVSKLNGYDLKSQQRKLRKILVNYRDTELKGVQANIKAYEKDFIFYPTITTFFESDLGGDPTKNFVSLLHTDRPFFVYLNEVNFQLFKEESHIKKSKEYLFGIRDLIVPAQAVARKSDGFKVNVLTAPQLKNVLDGVYHAMSQKQITFYRKAFIKAHRVIFNSPPINALVDEFVRVLISQEVPQGERYSIESFSKAMYDVCTRAYQIYPGF